LLWLRPLVFGTTSANASPLPVGRAWLGKLVALNPALVRRLAQFGADPKATDATRILRLTDSLHTGAGRKVDLIWQEKIDGQVLSTLAPNMASRLGRGGQPMLKTLPLQGVTVTGDAIFTQRAICQGTLSTPLLVPGNRGPGVVHRHGVT
jgi:hypothetical protein